MPRKAIICYVNKETNTLEVVMSPRPDVSEERKNQILEAALAVFARLGFQQTRMEDIAEQASLSKGALYLYYKSKGAIVAALLKYFFTQELKQLQALVAGDHEKPVVEQLLTLTHQLTSTMQWMAQQMPIAFEFYAIAGRDKEVRQFLQDYFKTYRSELARLIQRGIDRHEFRDVDAEAMAVTLAALYEGLALLCFVDPQAYQWAEQAETSVRVLLSGMQCSAGKLS
jgi:AcrR family transcriptional regulator